MGKEISPITQKLFKLRSSLLLTIFVENLILQNNQLVDYIIIFCNIVFSLRIILAEIRDKQLKILFYT